MKSFISLEVGKLKKDNLKVAGKFLKSRLIVGTGKYKSFSETAKAIKASGADMVTVAVRRVNILDKKKPILTDYINPKKIIFLPNTAGCFNSEEALRTLRLAREMGGWKLVKLEVLGDKKTLYPNMIETIKSTKTLVKEGFKVMVYCSDDPLLAKKLEDEGASAIMPLASPIGSGLGLQNKINLSLLTILILIFSIINEKKNILEKSGPLKINYQNENQYTDILGIDKFSFIKDYYIKSAENCYLNADCFQTTDIKDIYLSPDQLIFNIND